MRVFAPGLSMLWEDADPAHALRQRFGFASRTEISTWLTGILRRHWSLRVRQIERIVLSADNAIAWVQTDQGTFVVKVCADPSRFARLGLIADVVAHLGEKGLPVAAPRPTDDGAARLVLDGPRPEADDGAAGAMPSDGTGGARPVGSETGNGTPRVLLAGPPPDAGEAPVADDDRSSAPVLPPGARLSVIVAPLVPGSLLDTDHLPAVHGAGAVLAQLHLAVVGLPQAGHRTRAPDLHRRALEAAAPGRAHAPRAAARLDALLADLPDLDTPAQLVHHDFRGTNVLTDGPRVTAVLDFDEMSVDHPVVDLALAATMLGTGFTTWDPTPPAAQAALLAGYRSVRELSSLEERWLAALQLALALSQIPDGRNPVGWTQSVQHLAGT